MGREVVGITVLGLRARLLEGLGHRQQCTDTLYIEFLDRGIIESRDLDENMILDVDGDGNVLGLTLEHASTRTDIHNLTLEGIAA